jgi:hypothetical protein
MKTVRTAETTLGNLIVALTDEASEYLSDEQEVYNAVAFMLVHLLRSSRGSFERPQRWH